MNLKTYCVVLIAILLAVAAVATVRNRRQVDAYEKAMAECIKWATVNIADVDARAWCEP